MKNKFKKIILWCLHKESAYLLKRCAPKIIAVTGSVGKTTTKDALYATLHNKVHIRKNQKSFNSEIGVPLTVLGLPNAWNNPFKWLLNVVRGAWKALFVQKYPHYLILEIGVERPGDIDVLTQWVTPDIVILTALPEIPVHVEFFENKEEVWKEKRQLVKACKKNGTIILNYDDAEVMRTEIPEDCHLITYGEREGANHRVSDVEPFFENGILIGTEATIGTTQEDKKYLFEGISGSQSILPFAAASAVHEALHIEDKILDIKEFTPTPGRMRILPGKNESIIIDDSYNSSPIALSRGLEEVKDLNIKRKIAVLGDMLELGQQSVDIHRKIGEELFSHGFDILVTVGIRAAHFAEGAHAAGMSLNNIASFKNSEDLDIDEFLRENTDAGDIVYVKGSQGSRMEKLTNRLLDKSINPRDVLPRHDSVWIKK